MKRTSFFAIGFVLILAGAAPAQRRTVTNADLERYRQNRVQNEAQMRENYARMGFPSPEELNRRNDEANRSAIELAARIRADRIEQERLDAQYLQAMAAAAANQRPTIVVVDANTDPGYFLQSGYGFGGFGFGNRFRRGFIPTQQGYYAGGQFWPTGNATPSAPIVRRR